MIKITNHPPLGSTTVHPAQRSPQVEPTERLNKDAEPTPEQERPFVERRKGDRRQGRRGDRGPFDIRSGRDRRKAPPGRSVDVDA